MDNYLTDETWNALIDRLAGPFDPDQEGWTQRDEVIQALGEAGIWPAAIRQDDESTTARLIDSVANDVSVEKPCEAA
ncbi:MAG: hypothetical protein EOS25_26390 [Mesorhizobium sp.]|uniref:hypothetical protein n=1 Tax=Mesorhizobium sp. TaxID=1871066 RepID=UPI000FE801FA|nr:hypothetical protein [Mesorhizobium sp.]RWD50574.1 MAG: hypothetical protein EOS59_09260 [Mesorhizobium sp.]RWE55789.1 MAG: hypothetical protein EOS24_23245 [Mesorhizobium sp.]RWF09694.1 MAG: hypothetical protein EOS69_17240 [Mesorhizobium sp.]RWF14650.1 MAG: hypothetical protein EOS25_26390 [Mesorhizobium sp.]